MSMTKAKVEVKGFDDRSRCGAYGFIDFTDGMRIGYSPGSRGTNEDGLFNCKQRYELECVGAELRAAHITAATEFVRKYLKKDGDPS